MTNLFSSLYAKMIRTDVQTVEHEGRWFITMGNPGFNSATNNGRGYASEDLALAAIQRRTVLCLSKHDRMINCSPKSPLLFNPRS